MQTYDTPVPAPAVHCNELVIPKYSDDQLLKKMLAILTKNLQKLDASARQFHNFVQESNFIDCNYKDLLRILRTNKEINCERTLKCSSMLSSTTCRGPRTVRIKV